MGIQNKETFTDGRVGSLKKVSALASEYRSYLFLDVYTVLYCAGIVV